MYSPASVEGVAEEFTTDVNSFMASPCDHGGSDDEDLSAAPRGAGLGWGLGSATRWLVTLPPCSVAPFPHLCTGQWWGAVPDT